MMVNIMEEAADRPPDALLLQQVAAGNVDALEHLFRAYQRQVYQFALGITRDPETAEEVLQDVFYRLYAHADRINTTLPLIPWLYRVTANVSYNRARRRSFWTEPFHALAERLLAPVRRSPEYVAEQHELQSMVRQTLDEMPAKHRAVLILYYLHDYSIQEIALILDLPEGTIKSRLHHARKLLKERLLWRYGAAAILPD
ncbi:MAG TPA: sigma-70 family RNA polymerase sigma factor [Roseiflexaceae bacterium]|nr:sigma-70 family RNA polymerase sigma factor [Roseiflexaceae bacterium]